MKSNIYRANIMYITTHVFPSSLNTNTNYVDFVQQEKSFRAQTVSFRGSWLKIEDSNLRCFTKWFNLVPERRSDGGEKLTQIVIIYGA
jgi:hypothetical protein